MSWIAALFVAVVGAATFEAPDHVAARGVDAAVLVNWSRVEGAPGYILYYSDSLSGPWDRVNNKPFRVEEATVDGLDNGKPYYFYVVAVDEDGLEGKPSVAAQGVPFVAKGPKKGLFGGGKASPSPTPTPARSFDDEATATPTEEYVPEYQPATGGVDESGKPKPAKKPAKWGKKRGEEVVPEPEPTKKPSEEETPKPRKKRTRTPEPEETSAPVPDGAGDPHGRSIYLEIPVGADILSMSEDAVLTLAGNPGLPLTTTYSGGGGGGGLALGLEGGLCGHLSALVGVGGVTVSDSFGNVESWSGNSFLMDLEIGYGLMRRDASHLSLGLAYTLSRHGISFADDVGNTASLADLWSGIGASARVKFWFGERIGLRLNFMFQLLAFGSRTLTITNVLNPANSGTNSITELSGIRLSLHPAFVYRLGPLLSLHLGVRFALVSYELTLPEYGGFPDATLTFSRGGITLFPYLSAQLRF